MVPQNVQNYWDAQWWMFLHVAPIALVIFVACVGYASWAEYSGEDEKEKKSPLVTIGINKEN